MKYIKTHTAPEAIGPYSQAVMIGKTLYCSGQVAINPATKKIDVDDIREQTVQVLKNLSAVVEASGMVLLNIVKTTIYLKNMADFKTVNEIYGEFFSEHKPARATVEVSNLPLNALVEIDCIACME